MQGEIKLPGNLRKAGLLKEKQEAEQKRDYSVDLPWHIFFLFGLGGDSIYQPLWIKYILYIADFKGIWGCFGKRLLYRQDGPRRRAGHQTIR
jgi:hypothetical protein